MIKFQQSQALTSHFESFWSIVWWSFTVWKFQNFPITQILREINFWNSRSAKSAIIVTHLEDLNCDF